MQTVEYFSKITPEGYLTLPDSIRKQLAAFMNYKIKVHIEIFEDAESTEYSFRSVRKCLRPVKGNMSADILADRGERV